MPVKNPLLRRFLNNQSSELRICSCPDKANKTKQGWNDPSQTENTRISKAINGTLGGRISFGNRGTPVKINYLGGWEGQPGGSPKPLRNAF